jgi:acetyl esterase/lipase
MKWLLLILVPLVLLALAAYWFFQQPPPRQLDLADQYWPAQRGAKLLIKNQSFDPERKVKLDIWAPKTATSKPMPVIVFFYGGSWNSGSKDFYGFAGRALAEQGYIVVLPDYRLFPEVRFPAFLEDGAAAVAWVHDNIGRVGGDPDRIFLSGHSAGAYNAVMLALDRQWLGRQGKRTNIVKAVAALAGPYDFFPFDSESTINAFGKANDPKMTQPVHFADNAAPPLWLATGDVDTTVKPRNSKSLCARMEDAGGPAQCTIYAGVDHSDIIMAVAKPFRTKAPVLDEMVAFLRSVK